MALAAQAAVRRELPARAARVLRGRAEEPAFLAVRVAAGRVDLAGGA